jgi:hypothetical protein
MAKAKSLEDKEPITWAVFQGHAGNGMESASSHHAVGFLVGNKLLRVGSIFISTNHKTSP